MSRGRCCYGVVIAVLLVTGLLVSGAYFLGRYAIRDLSQSFFNYKGFVSGMGLIDSIRYGKVRVRDFSTTSVVVGAEDDEKSAFSPSISVSVEDFSATFDNKLQFNVDSVLLSYDMLRGREVRISIPHESIQVVMLPNSEDQVGDNLKCNMGAELVLGFRDNIFFHSLKKKWAKSERSNQIVYAHYRDGAGMNCESLGKKASIYDNADFEFHALGERGVKILADITAKKEDNSGFLSLGIKDLEVFLLSGDKSGFDVNIPQFKLWSDNFSSSISGVAFVSGEDIWGLLNNCKLDLLVETRGYERFFEFIGSSSWSVVSGHQNEDKFLRGIDALKRAVRSVSSFEKDSDSVTLEIKSDEGEQIKIGSKSLGEFIDVVRELYEKADSGSDLNGGNSIEQEGKSSSPEFYDDSE
ncbi:MAG: hypothetical protein AB8U44_03600 [Aaplasma endosymbiont of Hyalomma asiaticum]